jgi:L-malate glycosyltransferase
VHICMITGDFPPVCGAIGNYVYKLSKILKKRGYDVTVLTRGSSFRGIYATELDDLNILKIRYLPIYPFHVRFHGYFLNKYLLKNEKKFDLIHFHGPLVPSLKTNLPIVVTEHGTVLGDISNSTNQDLSSIFTKIFAREFIGLDYDVLRNSDVITTVSNSCMNEIKTMIPEKKEMHVVGNGVDIILFRPDPTINRDLKTILYTGRLVSRKGLIDLINSATYLVKKFPDVKFVLTGKGPYKKYLAKKIHQLELEKHFIFHNYVTIDKLIELYQNATLYVLPSYYEGLPTSLLEALSCGLPCIATNVEGNNELIINGVNGILIPPHEPEKLAAAIENLLCNDDLRNKYSINGRRTVVENYSWDIIAEEYIALYQKILAEE